MEGRRVRRDYKAKGKDAGIRRQKEEGKKVGKERRTEGKQRIK